MKHSYATVTDLFCGAGGSSLGVLHAGAEVSMAVNHWKLAVETHASNFPQTEHDCNDIAASHPGRYPRTDILIASPECTNHSIAKGRRRVQYERDIFGNSQLDPAAERSRATMWDVPRFAEHHDYALVIVENVIDARAWRMWDAWILAMRSLGYAYKEVYLNSLVCHPTPQSRDRLYVVFWKRGNRAPDLDIRPPCRCPKCGDVAGVQAWKRPNRAWGRYGKGGQYVYLCPACQGECHPYYVPALCAIDWSLPIGRIGDRAKPLKEKTLARIRLGLERFKGRDLLMEILYSHAGGNRARALDDTWPTQSGRQSLALIGANRTNGVPHPVTEPAQGVNTGNHLFITTLRGTSVGQEVDAPLGTVSAGGKHHGLVAVPFLTRHYTSDGNLSKPVTEPTGAITSADHHSLTVPPPFLTSYYGTGGEHPVDEAMPTMPSHDRHALVAPFVAELFGNTHARSVEEPLSTAVAAGIRHGLVAPFLVSNYGDKPGYQRNPIHPIDEAMPTVPGVGPFRLAVPGEIPAVEDCGFRMLEPHEIQAAMAFPSDYRVLGNKRDRVKQLGNAVTPPAMQILIDRCLDTLR